MFKITPPKFIDIEKRIDKKMKSHTFLEKVRKIMEHDIEIGSAKDVQTDKPVLVQNKPTRYEFNYLKDETIKRIIPAFKPEKIFIFGSYAKGTANEDSDLDILIEFKEVENKRKLAIQILKLFHDFQIATDILVMSLDKESEYKQKKWSIYYHALNEGKLIYERKHTGMENIA